MHLIAGSALGRSGNSGISESRGSLKSGQSRFTGQTAGQDRQRTRTGKEEESSGRPDAGDYAAGRRRTERQAKKRTERTGKGTKDRGERA